MMVRLRATSTASRPLNGHPLNVQHGRADEEEPDHRRREEQDTKKKKFVILCIFLLCGILVGVVRFSNFDIQAMVAPPFAMSSSSSAIIASSASSASSISSPGSTHTTTTHDDDDFQLAYSQSYGFFDTISTKSWQLLRSIYLEHMNHRNINRPLLYSKHDPYSTHPWDRSAEAWYQNNYEPNFNCLYQKRIGGTNTNGDGPKWVCNPYRISQRANERKATDPTHRGCVVYSIGSNGDFNFELGLQKEVGVGVCEYHIFDMGNYESSMPRELQRAYYHQWGLKKQDYYPNKDDEEKGGEGDTRTKMPTLGQQYYGLLDTIKLLGHTDLDIIDIFKIDCEDCEWETYMDWIHPSIPLLHQIQVEVHGVQANATLNFFDHLEAAGYLRFHKEPNIQYGPSCIEYSMIKVDTEFMNGKEFTFNTMNYTMMNGHLVPSHDRK
jgi:hypothetical protein